jgi:hypothetical protein
MKSQERKENEINALRMWIDRMALRLKGRALYALVGSLVLVGAILGLYFYWHAGQGIEASKRYMTLYEADTVEKLDDIIKAGPPDSNVVTFARLQNARLALFRDGIEKLGTTDPDVFQAGVAHIEKGRKLYKDIINDLKTDPALQQEAWISCAKAEESLLYVPKSKDSIDYLGNYDEMLKDFENAAAINPGSEVSKGYAAAAKEKKENRAEIEQFYRKLNDLRFVGTLKGSPFSDPGKGPRLFDPPHVP